MSKLDTRITTPEFRVAFPAVFETKFNKLKEKDEYSLVALFPKGADLTALKKAAQNAVINTFGADQNTWPKNLKHPFKDQGDRAKMENGKEVLPQGYEKGAIYLNLSSKDRPAVVYQDMTAIMDTSDFYGGCWAWVKVNAYAYSKGGNCGVSFGLGNIQKVRDGEPFGSRTRVEDDFTPIATPDAENQQAAASDLFM